MLLFIQIILILINVALIGLVYKGQRSYSFKIRALEIAYIFFVGSLSAWIAIQSSYDYVINPNKTNFMQNALNAGLVLSVMLAISFWRFLAEFSGKSIKKSLLCLHVILGILIALAGLILRPVVAIAGEDIIEYEYRNILYAGFTLYLLCYFMAGLWALYSRKKNHNQAATFAKNKRRLTIGIVASLVSIIGANVLIPIFSKNSEFSSKLSSVFLVFGATLLSLSAAFSAFNLGAFNLRKFIFRSILGVVSYLAPATAVIYVFSYGVTAILSSSSIDIKSPSGRILYMLSVLLGVAIIFAARKYFITKVTRLFTKNSFTEQDFASSVEHLIKHEFTEELTTKFAKLCKQYLGVDKVIIFVGGKNDSDMSEQISVGSSQQKLDQDAELTKLTGEIESYSRKKNSTQTNFIEDIQLLNDKDVNYMLRYEQAQLHGAIFLGSKLNGRRYYTDEIIVLRKALVEILLAMQNIFRLQQLVNFNQSLESKIELATKELRRTNDKLKALDEAKDEFISMASHQLRTPLTSIKGYISLILDGDMGKVPTKQKKMLQEAFSSSQRMVYLISDLLNVSRLRTGKFMIETTDVYLPDVVEEEIDQVKEMAEIKNIKIHYVKPKAFVHLELDDMKIRQVIMNFIDNAIHYTPEGGEINVELKETDKSVEFRVIDSGIGVPKSEQHHLFTKFYRAGNARKARPDGTGLGLFMGKKVVIASGGSLIFSSEEGKGSTFGFIFPKNKH